MSTFPSGTISLYGQNLAMENIDPYVVYIGYEGTVFHLAGPMAPVMGAQSGVVLGDDIKGLMAPFKNIGNQGARQDGITFQDSLFDEGLIDFAVHISAAGDDPVEARRVARRWIGAWDSKKQGRLS